MKWNIVGDGGAVGFGYLVISAYFIEDVQPRAEFEAFFDIVGDKEDIK